MKDRVKPAKHSWMKNFVIPKRATEEDLYKMETYTRTNKVKIKSNKSSIKE